MNAFELKSAVSSGKYDNTFAGLYNDVNEARARYIDAIDEFVALYGDGELRLFSAPGRTEVGGNHTDHQHGCVLAASVDLDVIAVAKKTDDNTIRVKSKGFDEDIIDLSVLTPVENEREHATALIRGCAARFDELGYNIGGFAAYTTSKVLKGSGLSSSAAFEVLICTVLNSLYNDDKMAPVERAIVSQYAENKFFGKPCGLMDQMASAVGGFVAIDFNDPAAPVIEKVDFDFSSVAHHLCIVDTGGCHADLTADYAAVPAEMKSVANALGKDVLRDVDEAEFYGKTAILREKLGDRAILRAIHFFNDNRRAVALRDALKSKDFDEFKRIIISSGRSSAQYLQNVFSSANVGEQGLSLALAISEKILESSGAWRVHGGGFAGTIQAFVPEEKLAEFIDIMKNIFGEKSCYVLSIRPIGGTEITTNLFAKAEV